MYLGFVLLTLGVAVAIDSAALLVAALLLALLLQALVIKPEEAVLSDSFGEAFESYRARTRRWL
jgi:protein-S-isoprenylcysteine O-methyltransferase Ste14